MDLLLLFLKWPEPGRTKTRLIPALGPEMAARLYRVLAEAVVEATAPRRGAYERFLCFAPREADDRVQRWFPNERLWAQSDGDLGQRMAAAFDAAFRRGASRAVLVGTDLPFLTRDHVTSSLAALDSAEVVLGPAEDGGYYLIALRRPQPKLFDGIAWSTSGVLGATLAKASALGLETRILEPMRDLDALEDLRASGDRLSPFLACDSDLEAAVARALARPDADVVFGTE